MTRILYYLLAALCCPMLLGSCSLEEDPRDQIAEDEAYTSEDALYRNTVATLYSYIGGAADGQGLQGTCRGLYDLQTFGSDEAMIPVRGGDWFDGGLWLMMYCHTWSSGHDFVKNTWLYLYKVITLCNRSLETLERLQGLTYTHYDEWTAEVRALRAMYYWYLIDLFGDVPLITSSDVSMNEVTREKRAKVYQFCIDELKVAAATLPIENSVCEGEYYGRMTAPVCDFLLAKLLLNHPVYTGTERAESYRECIELCEVLERFGYELESEYADNFIVHNQSSKENIFVIPMDRDLYSNQQQNLFRSYHYRQGAAYGFTGENGSCATLRTLEIFGYNTPGQDKRFDKNYYYGPVYDLDNVPVLDRTNQPLVYYPEEVQLDLSGSPYVETAGARMHKYAVDKNATKDGKLMDNDIVLFRYADVLLMRAEAHLRLGEAAEGQQFFDMVRERSLMGTRPLTLQNLLDERLLELCWEGWRRQDLIRFGQYRSLYDGSLGFAPIDESDGHTCIFPIPADVCALNSNLTQNPGY